MQDTCYYDGACGLCRRSVRLLRRLDWLGALAFEDLTRQPPESLPVPLETALEGMPMRCEGVRLLGVTLRRGRERVLVGFPAVRRALAQTPLGVLPAMMLYLPAVGCVGDALYRFVAARRGRDVCRVDAA